MNRDRLKALVMKHEGLRLRPYKDTVGKLSIGYGRNLDDTGISEAEAEYLLDNDIARSVRDCRGFPWFNGLSDARQNVVASMVFNMGLSRFIQFKRLISAIENQQWDVAANEMLSSKWAGQVGRRAVELSNIMATDLEPALSVSLDS